MSAHWTPDQFRDTFHEQVMKLVEDKASAGHVEQVEKIASEAAQTGGNVVDLTELLLRSMKTQKGGAGYGAKKATAATKSAPTKARKAA